MPLTHAGSRRGVQARWTDFIHVLPPSSLGHKIGQAIDGVLADGLSDPGLSPDDDDVVLLRFTQLWVCGPTMYEG